MRKLHASISFFLAVAFTSIAQDIATGTWRNHFNYSNAQIVVLGNDKIFCSSENGLFVFYPSTQEMTPISKQKGLSDVGVRAMIYDELRDVLVIGYESGLIDIVYSDHVNTIRTLKEAEVLSRKRILDFELDGDFLYAASDLGVILIDMEAEEARDVYRDIGPNGASVQATALSIHNDSLYIYTSSGLQKASKQDNLLDFNNWYHYPDSDTLKGRDFISLDTELHLYSDDPVTYRIGKDGWFNGLTLPEPLNGTYKSTSGTLAVSDRFILSLTTEGAQVITSDIFGSGNSIITFSQEYWIGDGELGLLRVQENELESYFLPGPGPDVQLIKEVGGELMAFHTPPVDEYIGIADSSGFSRFNGSWEIIKVPGLYSISSATKFHDELLLTSLGFGIYNYTESAFDPSVESSLWISDAMEMDGRLWITSFDDDTPLRAKSGDDSWQEFRRSQVGTNLPTSLQKSIGNVIWITRGSDENYGIVAFEPREDLVRLITTQDGLPSNQSTLDIDFVDEVWIGTTRGPAVFPDATFIFNNETAFTPFFNGQPLFENEVITAVAMDGGNRRWIGTHRGLFAFDTNLNTQIHHFTESNSPLSSDSIRSLSYVPQSGELFILTTKGLVSYQTDSSEPLQKHKNVRIYPNPVRPDFAGVLTISGIVVNSSIKITDVEGRIVEELQANGSAVSWDLRQFNGQKVQPGVYLVFSSNSTGEETFVGKFAILR